MGSARERVSRAQKVGVWYSGEIPHGERILILSFEAFAS